MKKIIPIVVRTHTGYKADEYPVSFTMGNEEIEIAGITDRWYQGDMNPEFAVTDYYKIRTKTGDEYIIKYEPGVDRWFILL
jgi:hypothetical protein